MHSFQQQSFLSPVTDGISLGIDEAGRGCLAGPVVAAAVLLPEHVCIEGLDDSKKLTAVKRQRLAKEIFLHAKVGLGLMWQRDIDRINILQATFHAMTKAVVSLMRRHGREMGQKQVHLFIDGNKIIPKAVMEPYWKPMPYSLPQQECIIGGDGLIPSIGAASIVAKTHRDHIMQILHGRYAMYNFAGHKGYGTKEHVAAIVAHGPCPLHRMTFAPISTLHAQNTEHAHKQEKKLRQGSLL